MKRLVRFTMSGINSIITDHFKMFFRDVLSKPWHEIKNRDGFDDQFLVFMAIVMEGNELASYLSIRDVAITGRSR